ncbi:MAG: acetylornithine transaminase [Thermodesulfobacteriota bacterium]
MATQDIKSITDQFIANTYARQPILLTRGEGVTLWDDKGNQYTDFLAGIAVCILGHAHPAVADAVCAQARKLCHVSNLFYTEPAAMLAKQLTDHSFADRVFFGNSGAEANEAAIKLSRKYAKENGHPERYRIITAEKSFHGRTMATLSATGQHKIHAGFEPLVEGFDYVPYNDLAAVRSAITDETCAILVEPVQGEGGVIVPDPGYLKGLRELCTENEILLMLDEIQTGMGRTGKLFAHEHFGITPDVATLAKGIANGLPMGAMLATEKAAEALTPGSHASTFGGNPVAAAAALVVVETLLHKGVLENCVSVGATFKDKLLALADSHDCVKNVRGLGLMLGMELDRDAMDLVARLRDKGFLVNCTQGTVLRFVPPLIITEKEIDALCAALDEVLP